MSAIMTPATSLTPKQREHLEEMWRLLGGGPTLSSDQLKALRVYSLIEGQGITEGARVFIRYSAMREPTQRQVELAAPAQKLGIPRQEYTGFYDGLHFNKKGEPYIRFKGLPERLVEVGRETNYRNFSLTKGTVHEIRLLSPPQSG